MKKLFKTGQIATFIFYTFTALSGFISLGDDNKNYDLIILRKPLANSKDIPMKISISCFLKSVFNNNFCWTNNSHYSFKNIIFLLFAYQIFKICKCIDYSYHRHYAWIFCLFVSIFKKTIFSAWIFFRNFISSYFAWYNAYKIDVLKKRIKEMDSIDFFLVHNFHDNRLYLWNLFSSSRNY